MPEEEVDTLLHKLAIEQNVASMDQKRALGILIKSFFGQVDRSLAEGQFVKQRAEALLDQLRENDT